MSQEATQRGWFNVELTRERDQGARLVGQYVRNTEVGGYVKTP
jgi:hypothetical protein